MREDCGKSIKEGNSQGFLELLREDLIKGWSKMEGDKQKKVQSLYRKIKQQNREDKNDNKIGAVIVSICLILLFLLYVLNAIFDL
ncbi:hypothetical protein [Mesobacillus zeae]|uniref:hypothetical protein n=1 Tax=Mesobacillus zeae TaxID=1917180 RepID=UPI00300B7DBC